MLGKKNSKNAKTNNNKNIEVVLKKNIYKIKFVTLDNNMQYMKTHLLPKMLLWV